MTHHLVSPLSRGNARKMRKQMTDAELKLWNEIRAHRLMGLSFRRQMPIAGYIVDFVCPTKKLIIEIDGSQHATAEGSELDAVRTAKLEALGWTILRFWNDDVIRDIDNVCQHIVISAGLANAEVPQPAREELVP
ncbi:MULTISPECIES: endonuclease domain-containing protein [unclassified Mesorhizobium]|uniref:endonuclease domain-containing protein n=1 Tax=unclassified Mesorhizobium TaxID=325217 RepID=UPI001CCE369F|nr:MULTISPECIES: endonuclease domain-containing protein [unclassified Mesorhizobium]MBZ9741168.1 endonuclease domain-containing protein [Mesorhizobium sp. CO1-1-4]MBZ9804224.1 endonuclease domain-containing protein [Mesorhizobium sp. ES1-6]